jgi:VanZ family protein
MRRLCRTAAFGLALYIVFVTLGPLSARPQTGHPQTERFAGYFVLGAVFSVAYPRHRAWIALGVVVGSIALELGQLTVPGRDAGLPDVIAKAFGGITGTAVIPVASLILHFARGPSASL